VATNWQLPVGPCCPDLELRHGVVHYYPPQSSHRRGLIHCNAREPCSDELPFCQRRDCRRLLGCNYRRLLGALGEVPSPGKPPCDQRHLTDFCPSRYPLHTNYDAAMTYNQINAGVSSACEQAKIQLIKLEGILFPAAMGGYCSVAIQNIVDELEPFGFGQTARPFDAAYRTESGESRA